MCQEDAVGCHVLRTRRVPELRKRLIVVLQRLNVPRPIAYRKTERRKGQEGMVKLSEKRSASKLQWRRPPRGQKAHRQGYTSKRGNWTSQYQWCV